MLLLVLLCRPPKGGFVVVVSWWCVSLFFFHFLRAPSAHLRRQTKIDQTSTTIVWLPIKGMQVARHDNKFGIPSDFFTGRCTLVII